MKSDSATPGFQVFTARELQPLFPNYTLEGLIAQSTRGAVYRAHQANLDRPVALKILPRGLGGQESFSESFSARAKATARLNHSHLIGIYDFGEIEGMLFIVMEYVEGGTLEAAAGTDPVDPRKAADLVSRICRGLAHAHEHGVIHRNLTPSGILLDAKLQPKIGDFGLGEQSHHEECSAAYTAPEVARGNESDHRADIYAAGMILHRLLTGRESSGPGPLRPPSSLCGSPVALDKIIAQATRSDPLLRYVDAAEMAGHLEEAIKGLPLAAKVVTPVKPTVSGAPPLPAPRAAPREPIMAHVPVRPILIMLGGAALAGGAYFLTSQDKQDLGKPMNLGGSPQQAYRRPVQIEPRPARAPEIEKEKEPVGRALFRLQGKLAAGTRDEFPEGTVTREGNSYLFVDKAMTWPEAHEYATRHGAYLAALPGKELRDWLGAQFHFDRPLWLGGGRAPGNQWQWIDGSPWHPDDSIGENEQAQRLAFSATGGLFSARTGQNYYALLQWRNDGSDPASLKEQLKRTAASAKKNDPDAIVYPFDTLSWEGSRYYYVDKEVSWEEARKLAELLGAYLAVPSSPAEHEWICSSFAQELERRGRLWLGGFRLKPGDRWQWISREAWNNSGWSTREPGADASLNRMALYRGSESAGWVANDGAEGNASGFLVEWSAPKPAVEVAKFELTPWLATVNRNFASRVEPELKAFEQARKKLVQGYLRAMNRIVRKEDEGPGFGGRGGPPRGGPGGFGWPGRRALEEIKRLLAAAEEAEAPALLSSLPEGASKALVEQHAKSEAELKFLEDTSDLKIKEDLTIYVEGMRKKAEDLLSKGYVDAGRELQELAEEVSKGDNAAFVAALFPGSPRAVLPWFPRSLAEPGPDQAVPGEPAAEPGFPARRNPSPPGAEAEP